jgi:hypothetical protein
MTIKIDFKLLFAGLLAGFVFVATTLGWTAEVIAFADPLNEMFFAFMAMFTGILCFLGSAQRVKQNK